MQRGFAAFGGVGRPPAVRFVARVDAGQVKVEFVVRPATLPAGVERLDVLLDGQVSGDLDFRACEHCHQAVLEQIRIDPPYRRQGLARGALQAAVDNRPGYRWSTSVLADTAEARSFWTAVGWAGVLGNPDWCAHMYEADRHTP